MNEKDKLSMNTFFERMERVRDIINEFVTLNYPHNDMEVSLKSENDLHLTYQYINCQTQTTIQMIHKNERIIFGDDNKYKSIFAKYGYQSWKDIMVSFDKILCINDHANGDITFDLFLDGPSQELMRKLIGRTEKIQLTEFNVQLNLYRQRDQQAFHVTIGTLYIKENDYNDFDSKLLMDILNHEMYATFPAIKLGNYPQVKAYMKYNTLSLLDNHRFKWDKKDVY